MLLYNYIENWNIYINMEEENINIEKFDIINPPETTENKMSNEPEEKEKWRKEEKMFLFPFSLYNSNRFRICIFYFNLYYS